MLLVELGTVIFTYTLKSNYFLPDDTMLVLSVSSASVAASICK